MASFITGIISLSISAVVLATVFIGTVKNTSTPAVGTPNASTEWTAGELAMWSLITLVAIVGLVFGVLNVFGLA